MNGQDPLANLADIIEPTAPGFWPLSLAWWLSILIGIAAAYLCFWLYKRTRRPVQKQAMALLTEIVNRYPQQLDNQQLYIELSALMRRLARTQYPESNALAGSAWLDFLNKTGGTNAFSTGMLEDIADAPYRKIEPKTLDTNFIQSTITQWIKKNLC